MGSQSTSRPRRLHRRQALLYLATFALGFAVFALGSSPLLGRQPARSQQTVSLPDSKIHLGVLIHLWSINLPEGTLSAGVNVVGVWGGPEEPSWDIPSFAARHRQEAIPATIPIVGNPAFYPFDTYSTTVDIYQAQDHFLVFYQDGLTGFDYTASQTTDPFECCLIFPVGPQAGVQPRYPTDLALLPDGSLAVMPDYTPKAQLTFTRPTTIRLTALLAIVLLGVAIWIPLFLRDTSSHLQVTVPIILGLWGIRLILVPPSITWATILDQTFLVYFFWIIALSSLRIIHSIDRSPAHAPHASRPIRPIPAPPLPRPPYPRGPHKPSPLQSAVILAGVALVMYAIGNWRHQRLKARFRSTSVRSSTGVPGSNRLRRR